MFARISTYNCNHFFHLFSVLFYLFLPLSANVKNFKLPLLYTFLLPLSIVITHQLNPVGYPVFFRLSFSYFLSYKPERSEREAYLS